MRALPSNSFRSKAVLALVASLFPSLHAQVSDSEMVALESKLPAPASAPVDFNQHIRPILENSCLRCHGPEKPKGKYRLDSAEAALNGGEHGIDIVPGQSARSPIVFYTARLVEDMEMPPAGKGDPLTQEQVAMLRAWIDQGAKWGDGSTNQVPRLQFSVTPSIQWFTVTGNEQKFRDHTGIKEGWNGGAQSIYLREQLAPGRTLTLEGRTYLNPEEYRFRLQLEQKDLGFIRMGFEQYREYYSDSGGSHPMLDDALFSLDRDLHLDIGRAWASFGLTIPDRPRITLGYELQYRDGTKSTLQWGDAGTIDPADDPLGTDAKKVYPAEKSIDEKVHIVKLDLSHEIRRIGIENKFTAEFYESDVSRRNTEFYNTGNGTEKFVLSQEKHDHFQASDAFQLEKQVLDWLFLSGGYYYSRLEGDYSFNNQTISPAGAFSDNFWWTDSIILEQDTHVFNANTQLGPWDGLTLFGGVQSEWMSQRGFGEVQLDQGIPGAIVPEPTTVDTDLDRSVIEEHTGLRYTKIPFTVLFLEGRLAQESIGQSEDHVGGGHEFLRDTDATSDLYDGRAGFTVSPWTRVSLTAQYKHRTREADYDHVHDEQFGIRNEGYSAFITSRETETDELALKLTLRPATWLKTALTYQKIATDYTTRTDPYIIPELIIPGFPPFPEQVLSPGGLIFAGEYDADVYGITVNLNPWHRLTLSATFTFRDSETTTSHNLSPLVVAYEGDVYSSLSSATFVLNNKTDLFASYNYSKADYDQGNVAGGLPVGLVYDWHAVTAGISRRWKENIMTSLQYRYYHYDEGSAGGGNNYTAHGVLASLTMSLN